MGAAISVPTHSAQPAATRAKTATGGLLRVMLIGAAFLYLAFFLLLPLVVVFAQAFAKGAQAYFSAIRDPETLSAIRLTFITAGIAVPLNLLFGLAAAWCITKFTFRGKNL